MRRRLLPLFAAAVLAGCGGHHAVTTPTAPAPRPLGHPHAALVIAETWTTFFEEPAAQAPLLQRSATFSRQLAALRQSVLAHKLRVHVQRVVVHGDTATVTYTLRVAGKAVLRNAEGTAVRVGGRWRVGVASFCRLLALAGSTPDACG